MPTIQSVVATINGSAITLTYNSESGKYEAVGVAPSASSFNLTNGYYPVSVTATYTTGLSATVNDQTAGTVGQGCRFVVKEKVKPTISITYPTAGQFITTVTGQHIELSLRDNDSGVKLSAFSLTLGSTTLTADDFTVTAVSGGYDLSYTPSAAIADGSYNITATVEDNDGNTSDTAGVSFTIDTAPPELSVTSPVEGLATHESTVTVSGTTRDSAGGTITVGIYLDNTLVTTVTPDASGNFSYALTLDSEGDKQVKVIATDAAGASSTVERNIYYSSATPNITAVELVPNPADAGATYIIKVTVV